MKVFGVRKKLREKILKLESKVSVKNELLEKLKMDVSEKNRVIISAASKVSDLKEAESELNKEIVRLKIRNTFLESRSN